MGHVAAGDDDDLSIQFPDRFGYLPADFLTGIPTGVAENDGHYPEVRPEILQEWNLDLDGVFVLVGDGIFLQVTGSG
ncbi:hypothetical protein ES703_52225 [subsurface metagenome]